MADELGLPFATVCNALLLHPDPAVPPYFTSWRPRDASWARLRNRIAWAGLSRLYAPILGPIQQRRRRLGLSVPARIADTWSSRLQISQQAEAFEFPRRILPKQVRFVGPLQPPGGYPTVPFPWDRLDGRPLIYASLGTLVNRVSGTFRTIAEACDGLDAQLVISTGRGVSPDALGDLPGRPVVVHYAAPGGTSPQVCPRDHPRRPEHRSRGAEYGSPHGGRAGDQRSAGSRCPDGLDWGRGGDSPETGDQSTPAVPRGPGALESVVPRGGGANPRLAPGRRRRPRTAEIIEQDLSLGA